MNEEKFYCGAIDFWEKNKELDSLHLLNKFMEEKYLPKLDIIKEVREILRKHICNPSGLKDGWHIDCWNNEDISKLNEDLGILDKENINEENK